MDFQLSTDQKALRAGTRELLERRFGRDALRAAVGQGPAGRPRLDRKLWRALGDAGFFCLRVPEAEGGLGLGLPEAVLVFEEAGRALLPGPLVATFLAARDVAGAATGETVVTAVDGGLVAWLDEADAVHGDTSGAVAVRSVDPLTPLHRVPAGGAPGEASGKASGQVSGEARWEAALLRAAEHLGSAARTLDLAVQYARTREQFGRPIGAFQAVQHLCADMLVRAELARAAVYAAAVTADPLEATGAELLAADAAVRNARDCLQVHGGMGFTWESDVHLHLKRAWVRSGLAGPPADAEERLARGLAGSCGP
ncbi:acyl-CoA dehydrogenase family protein [Streptomyces sp. G45]|uniref:acyl-CoA dehydrogenase family protein n=1 Tax=Streptomyces sp. G45 TaxID=3406627 RepID=UPI003C26962F